MSERPVKIILEDIFEALEAINSYLSGTDYNVFLHDRMRRDAVLRNIEVIGEAINQLPESFLRVNNQVEWHKAVSMRNRLIHAYFDVDFKIVWNTCDQVLPDFEKQIKQLYSSLPE